MKGYQKNQVVISLVFILVISSLAIIQANTASNTDEKIIEVCKNGIVYIPPGTNYVMCYGKIMKIIKVVPYEPGKDSEACACPQCCGGECYVIIACEGAPQNLSSPDSSGTDAYSGDSSGGTLCILWLDCE